MKKIVLFGGGTGLSTLLSSLKKIEAELVIAVAISDNGGSTGKVRDYYGIPAPGDLRRVVVELSENQLLKEVCNYRFDKQLENHTIGNLIITALTDLKGNMSEAIKEYSKLLGVKQKVYPISNDSATLSAVMNNNSIISGETQIAKHEKKIKKVYYEKNVCPTKEIIQEIKTADMIIFSCGSLYTSLLPNLVIPEIINELKNSKAKKVYIANIMTQLGETENYTLSEHIQAIENHTYRGIIDYVLANNNFNVDTEIMKKYKKENSELVKIDFEKISKNTKIFLDDYILIDKYIRHNTEKLSLEISRVLKGNNG